MRRYNGATLSHRLLRRGNAVGPALDPAMRRNFGLTAAPQPAMTYLAGLGAPAEGATPAPGLMELWRLSPEYRKGVWVGAGAIGALWLGAILWWKFR